mmetsp:Transcript_74463/g.131584  ORF Transcript_74463/g.131584 Transcript_74463/m.131584 type:complete len:80 (+) Transcript_74463:127-366(+)
MARWGLQGADLSQAMFCSTLLCHSGSCSTPTTPCHSTHPMGTQFGYISQPAASQMGTFCCLEGQLQSNTAQQNELKTHI